LKVQPDCAKGQVSFHGKTPSGEMNGAWHSYCNDGDATLTIVESVAGIGQACEVDADCGGIECLTACMQCEDGDSCAGAHVCMPASPLCMRTSEAVISPEMFEDNCPPDWRDSVCMDTLLEWDSQGCDIYDPLLEDPSLPLPYAPPSVVAWCLGYVSYYHKCLDQKFPWVHRYRQARRMPQEFVDKLVDAWSNPPTTTQTTGVEPEASQCVMIPTEVLLRHKVIPCGGKPMSSTTSSPLAL